MIWFFVLLAVMALAWLESRWAPYALRFIKFHGQCDKILAQPGESVTWTSTVENHSRLPVPFIRLELRFPNALTVKESPEWIRTHYRTGIQQWNAQERLALMPRQSCTRKVSFTAQCRGEYTLGSCRFSVGDILGFRETGVEAPPGRIVVIPEKAKNSRALQAVGGFLGDLSVRRFILEDPILTIGFRDYTGQEPMKAVSWTRTAITGQLQVKQYDHTAEQTVTVLLNTEDGSPEELEGAFRLMRSVCEELERKKIPFGLRTNGNLPGPVGKLFRLSEGLGSQHLNTILYSLGRADYTCYHSFRDLTRKALEHRKSNESYIVVTPRQSTSLNAAIRQLEAASGNPVCVLFGSWEVEQE